MRHLFINLAQQPSPTWSEAFPDRIDIRLKDLGGMGRLDGAVLWLRLVGQGQGPGLLADIRQRVNVPIVVMSDIPTESDAATCMAAGAAGYCNTHAAPEVLQQVASVVMQGGLWLGQELMQRLMGSASVLLSRQPVHSIGANELAALTERELDVARRVAVGASNREIADQLGITERTVKAHLGTIFSKLQVRDRLQLSLKINGLWP